MHSGIDQILTELKSTVGFAHNSEITLEMDPGTFDSEKLVQLRAAGVTRLSLGIQSFDSEILKKCGRAHTVDDVARALKLVLASEFKDNFSIDLISSLPGLTIDLWQDTLEKAAASGCSHISVYDLQIEDKTAFGRWYSPGVFPLPTDELSALMYCRATEVLKSSGFEHYEVSNYAKPGKRSQHNQRYWKCKPTWGFGMGAASYIGNNRFTRPDRLVDYKEWVGDLEVKGFTAATVNIESDEDEDNDNDKDSNGDSILDEDDIDNDDGDLILSDGIVTPVGATDLLEVVMLALRTSDGLNLRELRDIYGDISVEKLLTAVLPFKERGLIEIKEIEEIEEIKETITDNTDNKDNKDNIDNISNISNINGNNSIRSLTKIVCLTDPKGFLLSNDIISSVFVELTC